MQTGNNRRCILGKLLRGHCRGCAAGMHGKANAERKDGMDGMDGLLEKIYREAIYPEDDAVRMENRLAAEIDRLVAVYPGRLDEKEEEMFRAVIYEAAFAAEAKAFWLGVKYAYRLSKWL